MTKKKALLIGLSSFMAVGMMVAFNGTKNSLTKTQAEQCSHTHVEHYEDTVDHAEHWACCECHNAWSDSLLVNLIGNTVTDRSRIDIPRVYSYNNVTGKIEYGRNGVVAGTITPDGVVTNMKYHANNNNVMQFEAADNLEKLATQDLTILNPQNVFDTYGLSSSSKNTLYYWSDSHTFGFQEGGVFAGFGFGKFIGGEDLVLTDGSHYYVINVIGAVCSERIGLIDTVAGFFKNRLLSSFEHNGNYYADIALRVDRTFWNGGDETGTDWTYNGGTSYVINKVSGGETTEFVHVVNGNPANGTFPTGIKEATVKAGANPQQIRLGIDGTKITAGDKLILKAGSIFTDDGNGKDAVLARQDMTLVFNGSAFEELPTTYAYNKQSGKIEVNAPGEATREITPDGYVANMKFHGNNNNVMQFEAADNLEKLATQDLTILNPENVYDSFGLSASSKKALVYWNDSHTFGFQEGGKFAGPSFGKFIAGEDLVLTDGSHYYVVGVVGAAFSERIGIMDTVAGFFKKSILNTFEHNGNYYVDLLARVETTFWSGSLTMGTDWAYNGGTSYVINKVSGGETTEFVHVVNGNPANGTFPAGMKEATIYAGENPQYIRMGFDGTMIAAGDQLVIKAGSILSDDGNGKDAVIVTSDIVLNFDGSGFSL